MSYSLSYIRINIHKSFQIILVFYENCIHIYQKVSTYFIFLVQDVSVKIQILDV